MARNSPSLRNFATPSNNYLRFYLKYIEPVRAQIKAGVLEIPRLDSFDTIMGLQLQNLVLNNVPLVMDTLGINPLHLRSASPYFQNKTLRQDACQIDLLIDTTPAVYLCEIKFRRRLDAAVAKDVDKRVQNLAIEGTGSVRRVLIYMGELSAALKAGGTFDQLISFEQLLQAPAEE